MNSSAPKRILMVGRPDNLSALKSNFESEGVSLSVAPTLADARQDLIENGLPDGLLINLDGFEEDGLAFCHEMNQYPGLPVIVLGAVQADDQTVMEALVCADGYLRAEETESAEIIARLSRLFSRINSAAHGLGRTVQLTKGVVLDLIGSTVSISGNDTPLTPTEIALLHVLLTHKNEMVDSTTLIDRVWRGASEGNPNSLRVHMHRLRRKLGWKKRDATSLIRTVRGVGYMLHTQA